MKNIEYYADEILNKDIFDLIDFLHNHNIYQISPPDPFDIGEALFAFTKWAVEEADEIKQEGVKKMKTLNEILKEYGEYTVKDEKALLKFLEKPTPKTIWELHVGDKYFFINDYGDIYSDQWENCNVDIARRENDNCYLTEGEAVFALEKKKIIAEMKRLGGTENMMSLGNEDTIKYSIRYRHGDKLLYIDRCNHIQAINIYFATYEQAQKAIDEIGEDKIKKYLFYVEDGE